MTFESKKNKDGAKYVPPRIVTYSAEELDKHVPRVAACDSFDPFGFSADDGSSGPLTPTKPGGSY